MSQDSRKNVISRDHILFTAPLTVGLEVITADIFSSICGIHGVDYAGIYVCADSGNQFDMVCHYNYPGGMLARMVKVSPEAWYVKTLETSPATQIDLQEIPLQYRLIYELNGVRSLRIIPLVLNETVVGSIHLASYGETFLNGFEALMVDSFAERIARIMALHCSVMRMHAAREGLSGLMRIPGEATLLWDEIQAASKKISDRIDSGIRNRELPFRLRKVVDLLECIDGVSAVINEMSAYCLQQSGRTKQTLHAGQDNRCTHNEPGPPFADALRTLAASGKKSRVSNGAFDAGKFRPLPWPVTLERVAFGIKRLTFN